MEQWSPALIRAVREAARAEGAGRRRQRTVSAWDRARARFKLLPSQEAFLASEAREALDCGGFRSGKTVALCIKLVQRASVQGAREGLFRREGAALRRTTLLTLLQGDGLTPPVLEPGTYVHRSSEGTIDLAPSGGGTIVYLGAEDLGRIRGMSLTGAAVDQAEELDEGEWTNLIGRVSVGVPGLPRQLYGVCNADHPAHHLVSRFAIEEPARRDPARAYFESSARENPHIPADYVPSLEAMPDTARLRYLENKWVAADGLVYDTWDHRVHLRQRSGPWVSAVLGVDPGYSHRCGISLVLIDADGWIHLAAQSWREKMVNAEKRAEVERLRAIASELYCRIKVDSADANFIAELRQAGIPAEPADKDDGSVLRGIGKIQSLLLASSLLQPGENPDDPAVRRRIGRPGFTVDPTCEGWKKEVGAYQWDNKAKRDKPKKGYDDALDSTRYAVDAARVDSSGARLRVVRA